MIIVNLFGAPGAGKSTGAAYIFSKLKMAGVNAELVTEFAKDKVWEENKEVFNNQAYIFGKQYFKITRCADKVDVIITDSPLLLSAFYNDSDILGEEFNELVAKIFNSYNSINYLVEGRLQTEQESNAIAEQMEELLTRYRVNYTTTKGCIDSYDRIVEEILTYEKVSK